VELPNLSRDEKADDRPSAKIIAVLVTYLPDRRQLRETLAALLPQVDAAAVVDNGSPGDLCHELAKLAGAPVHCIPLEINLGVAAAQNIGIRWARAQEATHVLLFDQDSEPAPDMVSRLLGTAQEVARSGTKLAAVVPVIVDPRQLRLRSFSCLGRFLARRFDCDPGQVIVGTATAISSGSLIPMASLAEVGGMREELFVDLVDIEWFLRARSLGYRAFGVCDALLRHRLGGQPKSVAGRKVTHHSAPRSYYFYRNAVWLMRQGYVPASWKLAVARRLLWRYLYYPLAVPPRWGYLRMMTLGIRHGVEGRLGRFDSRAPTVASADPY
jgi:rhamnosyltransferase